MVSVDMEQNMTVTGHENRGKVNTYYGNVRVYNGK